jgi:DNA-binding MarR family transcriptional regulator
MSLLLTIGRMQPAKAGDLAAAEGVKPPSLTRSLGRLADRGLIIRTSHPEDGRVSIVSLTEEGELERQCVLHNRDVWLQDLLMALSQEEWDRLAGVLPILEQLCGPALSPAKSP